MTPFHMEQKLNKRAKKVGWRVAAAVVFLVGVFFAGWGTALAVLGG